MTSAVNRSSSGRPRGTLRCVERCCPSAAQARRSETCITSLICSMQARRRAGLRWGIRGFLATQTGAASSSLSYCTSKERNMSLYAGLDISVKTTSICVVEGNGHVLLETTVDSSPDAIAERLCSFDQTIERIGLEAGPLSQWIYGGLVDVGLAAICVE